MARMRIGALLPWVVWHSLLTAAAAGDRDGKVTLQERAEPGQSSKVVVELKASGLLKPGLAEGVEAKAEKPLAMRIEARFAFVERVLEVSRGGRPRRVARQVAQAAAARNGEVLPEESAIRPAVSLLVAEMREGSVFTYSPGGPLTRTELELAQGPADPLALAGLLPEAPAAAVKVDDHWKVSAEAARSLSGYDALAVNGLEATLTALDEDAARFRLRGEVQGAVLGGEGTIACDGTFTFDRKAGRIDRLDLERSEVRKPGPVEAGLDLKSTLSLDRHPCEAPAALADAIVAALPTEPDPTLELLQLAPPGGKFTLRHDRDWHTFSETTRLTVLKRLDHGEVVAQCNLANGPDAGRGRHQDLDQFRDDVRSALGRNFGRIVGEGEVEGDPAGGFRHKIAVGGKVGDVGVRWFYYLVASPAGDQLLATFTLTEDQTRRFADQDTRLIGSLRWRDREAATDPAKPPF